MPYEAVAEKLKTVPDEYLKTVSDFIDYITVRLINTSEKSDNLARLKKVYARKDDIPPVSEAGLEVLQEMLKNDTW